MQEVKTSLWFLAVLLIGIMGILVWNAQPSELELKQREEQRRELREKQLIREAYKDLLDYQERNSRFDEQWNNF